jgi:hypothetical protein
MDTDAETRWTVTARRYYDTNGGEGFQGVAEKVRTERRDHVAWIRILETVYWWPWI